MVGFLSLDTEEIVIFVLACLLVCCCCGYCSYLSALQEHDDDGWERLSAVQKAHAVVHKSIRRLSGTAKPQTEMATRPARAVV